MKRVIIPSALLLAAAILLPLAFSRPSDRPDQLLSEETPSVVTPEPEVLDTALSFTALVDGETLEYTAADYLPGVVAGEMPASFEFEALKAQAVAARTYIMYSMERVNPRHPDADVCNDPGCCKCFLDTETLKERWGDGYGVYWMKVCRAVSETDGLYISFEDKPILAAFHSSSPGMTEASSGVWGDLPYLISVGSPETEADVPNFVSTVEVAVGDFQKTVLDSYPDADLSGEPESWIGEVSISGSSRVTHAVIGGVSVPGTVMRSMFSLRSASFALEYTDGCFLFTVTGYGHGVGMSQYGANVMAKQGAKYDEILLHYYPDTLLSKYISK